jgi:hypothetical protein
MIDHPKALTKAISISLSNSSDRIPIDTITPPMSHESIDYIPLKTYEDLRMAPYPIFAMSLMGNRTTILFFQVGLKKL